MTHPQGSQTRPETCWREALVTAFTLGVPPVPPLETLIDRLERRT